MRFNHSKLKDLHEDDLLTSGEVANVFGLAERTIQQWRINSKGNGKNLKYKRFGYRTVRYRVGDIREFIKNNNKGEQLCQ